MSAPGDPQAVVLLRVVIKSPDVETFIDRYSRFVKEDRIFIFTKQSQPPGSRVRFSLELVNGTYLLSGEGVVTRVRGESGDAAKPPGMELRFVPLDDLSRERIFQMLDKRGDAPKRAPVEPPPAVLPVLERTGAFDQIKHNPPQLPPAPPPPPPPPDDRSSAATEINATIPGPPLVDDRTSPLPAMRDEPTADPETSQGLGQPTDAFAAAGPAPAFSERFAAKDSTVPANPFSEISDGAIEYFVEWSLEQSRQPKPVEKAEFGSVRMASPGATRERDPRRAAFVVGLAVGIALGAPLGAVAVWQGRRAPAQAPQQPTFAAQPATVDLALAEAPDLAPAGRAELEINSTPPGAEVLIAGQPRGKTPLVITMTRGSYDLTVKRDHYVAVNQVATVPGNLNLVLRRPPATLHVESEPPGGEVAVDGKPRGKAPVDLTLDAFHRYDVQVSSPGARPWRRKVVVKPPQTAVTAKLSLARE